MLDRTYYLVRFDTVNPKEDFSNLSSWLANDKNLVVDQGSEELNITHKDGSHHSVVKLMTPQTNTQLISNASMLLQCDTDDSMIVILIRSYARELKYRVYSTYSSLFLPVDPELADLTQYILNEKVAKVFNRTGFTPFLLDQHTDVFYARNNKDETVHIINTALLSYYHDFPSEPAASDEFSYPVAKNQKEFVAFADAQLIPVSFYRYFKKPLTIINQSDFTIQFINRKIFLKPFYFVYNQERQSYEPLGPEHASINYADKIRAGETLEKALIRITQELNLNTGFVRAKVAPNLDFDRDKEGILTPRLWVSIYLDQISQNSEIQEKLQRGWVSLQKSNDAH